MTYTRKNPAPQTITPPNPQTLNHLGQQIHQARQQIHAIIKARKELRTLHKTLNTLQEQTQPTNTRTEAETIRLQMLTQHPEWHTEGPKRLRAATQEIIDHNQRRRNATPTRTPNPDTRSAAQKAATKPRKPPTRYNQPTNTQ